MLQISRFNPCPVWMLLPFPLNKSLLHHHGRGKKKHASGRSWPVDALWSLWWWGKWLGETVGERYRRRYCCHQLIESVSHYLQGCIHPRVIVWDFFHQGYSISECLRQRHIIRTELGDLWWSLHASMTHAIHASKFDMPSRDKIQKEEPPHVSTWVSLIYNLYQAFPAAVKNLVRV